MSFRHNEYNQFNSWPDGCNNDMEETADSGKEKILALITLLAVFAIIGFFNFDLVKHVFSLPKNAYKNYVIQHAKHFAIDYIFKQGTAGNYTLDVKNAEIDPRATYLFIHVWDDKMDLLTKRIEEIAVMKTKRDGSRVYSTVVPKETKYLTLHFCYIPEKDEMEPLSNADNFVIATNYKRIFFDQVRGERKIIDKPEYNLVTKVKTYNANGRETSNFMAGDEIYVKIFNYTTSSISGRDKTSEVTDNICDILGNNQKVLTKMPKVTNDYLIFKAVGEGEASFTYLDAFCTMKDLGKVKVKGERYIYY